MLVNRAVSKNDEAIEAEYVHVVERVEEMVGDVEEDALDSMWMK